MFVRAPAYAAGHGLPNPPESLQAAGVVGLSAASVSLRWGAAGVP